MLRSCRVVKQAVRYMYEGKSDEKHEGNDEVD